VLIDGVSITEFAGEGIAVLAERLPGARTHEANENAVDEAG
jgi:hypothetical protein